MIFLVFGHFFFVPISYLKIMCFLRIQNKKIGGKNETSFIKIASQQFNICSAQVSNNLNGPRRQKNIVSIYFNLLVWCVEVLGDMIAFFLRTYDFHLAMNVTILCSCGITPIIYLIGAQNMIQRLVSVIRREIREGGRRCQQMT